MKLNAERERGGKEKRRGGRKSDRSLFPGAPYWRKDGQRHFPDVQETKSYLDHQKKGRRKTSAKRTQYGMDKIFMSHRKIVLRSLTFQRRKLGTFSHRLRISAVAAAIC